MSIFDWVVQQDMAIRKFLHNASAYQDGKCRTYYGGKYGSESLAGSSRHGTQPIEVPETLGGHLLSIVACLWMMAIITYILFHWAQIFGMINKWINLNNISLLVCLLFFCLALGVIGCVPIVLASIIYFIERIITKDHKSPTDKNETSEAIKWCAGILLLSLLAAAIIKFF